MKNSIVNRSVRWSFLAAVLILVTFMGRMHQIIKLYPPIDAFCPFGALESAWAFIRYQGFLKRIKWSSFILMFSAIGTALIFRRSFCGQICPLGFLQDIFSWMGRKIFRRRFELPLRVDRILRYVKYLILFAFTALAWKTLSLVIRPFDPWVAYHHIGSDELFTEYLVGTLILGLMLAGALFSDRPFCRYLCPMGGFLAIPSKIGLTRIKRHEDACTSCGFCDESCPMALSVSTIEEMRSAECISCGECVNACPEEGALEYSLVSRKRISPLAVTLGTVLILVLVLGGTTLNRSFVWKAESGLPKTAERLLRGPGRIGGDNTPLDIVQVFKIHPAYFVQTYGLETEEQFYRTLEELEINPEQLSSEIERLYSEAGLDASKPGGGGCSDH